MKVWFLCGLAFAGLAVALTCWLMPLYAPTLFFWVFATDPGKMRILTVLLLGGLAAVGVFGGLALRLRFSGRG